MRLISEDLIYLQKRLDKLEARDLDKLFAKHAAAMLDSFQRASDERVARVEAAYAEEVATLRDQLDATEAHCEELRTQRVHWASFDSRLKRLEGKVE